MENILIDFLKAIEKNQIEEAQGFIEDMNDISQETAEIMIHVLDKIKI